MSFFRQFRRSRAVRFPPAPFFDRSARSDLRCNSLHGTALGFSLGSREQLSARGEMAKRLLLACAVILASALMVPASDAQQASFQQLHSRSSGYLMSGGITAEQRATIAKELVDQNDANSLRDLFLWTGALKHCPNSERWLPETVSCDQQDFSIVVNEDPSSVSTLDEVWDKLAQKAEPAELRRRIVADVLLEAKTPFQFELAVSAAGFNWGTDVERNLWRIVTDKSALAQGRVRAAEALYSDAFYTMGVSDVQRRIAQVAFDERHSQFALAMARSFYSGRQNREGVPDAVAHDDRVVLLVVDLYKSVEANERAAKSKVDTALTGRLVAEYAGLVSPKSEQAVDLSKVNDWIESNAARLEASAQVQQRADTPLVPGGQASDSAR